VTHILEKHLKQRNDISKALRFQSHLTAIGYQNSTARIHSLGTLSPVIMLQYVCGGQNYWDMRGDAPGLVPYVEREIIRRFSQIVDAAVASMEVELNETRIAAAEEYKELFNQPLPEDK
jgi:hypothetical protein